MTLRETHREYEERIGVVRPPRHCWRVRGQVLCGRYAYGDFASSSVKSDCKECLRVLAAEARAQLATHVGTALDEFHRALDGDSAQTRKALEDAILAYGHALFLEGRDG